MSSLFICSFRLFDWLGIWRIVLFFWKIRYQTRPLTDDEKALARLVFAPGQINLERVRIHDGSPICRLSGARAVASFHLIHYPPGGESPDVLIHELAHVAQYEKVGARYAPEALLAQWKWGRAAYDYEREGRLETRRAAGFSFKNLNREAQAQLVQDWFVLHFAIRFPRKLLAKEAVFELFMEEMRRGEF